MEKDNRGVLFINDKTNDKQPDFKGNATVNGVDYWVSGWNNVSSSGNKYISISLQKKEKQGVARADINRAKPQEPVADIMDDDIPFN